MAGPYRDDAYLTVVARRETGRYHGAFFLNVPTPSGCDRWQMRASHAEGFDTARAAAENINASFPDVKPLDVEALAAEDRLLDGLVLSPGAVLTRLRPQRSQDAMEEGQPDVEVRVEGKLVDLKVGVEQLERLETLGRIEFESSSGWDENLYYRYDHYVPVRGAGTRSKPPSRRKAA